jgi:magnesium-transporting ATPase (P-type)
MGVQVMMKKNNDEDKKSLNILTYLVILIFTLIVNFVTLLFSFEHITNILYCLKLFTIRPVIFPPLGKLYAICFTINVSLLLLIEFVIICIFRKRLNSLFKTNNLFTIKKFLYIAVVVIGLQMIISCWLWSI